MTAIPGASFVSFTGGNLPVATSCAIVIAIQGIGAGNQVNMTGAISANESGAGATSNPTSLAVVTVPTVSMAFGAPSVALNQSTLLTITIVNPNTVTALSGLGIADTVPASVMLSAGAAVGTCVAGGPGVQTAGVVVVNPATNQFALQGLTLSAGGSCSLSMSLTSAAPGALTNVSGNITGLFDSGSGQLVQIAGGTSSAALSIVAPPTIGEYSEVR